MSEDDEVLAKLVHDIRTPLTLVLGFTDLLRRRGDELSPDQREEFLQRIDDAAKDLKRIVDDVRPPV